MATIIKQGSTHEHHEQRSGHPMHPLPFRLEDMASRADDYLAIVREEATKIVQEAHRQAEGLRRDAEKAGRQAAEAAVEKVLNERVAAHMESLAPALEQMVAELADARVAWQRHWEGAVVRLATGIAEKIMRRTLQTQPEIALDLVAEALRLASSSADVVVHLSPADFATLGDQARRLAQSISRVAPADVVADPAISPGGCIVRTRFGEIDMQLESQLARIVEELG